MGFIGEGIDLLANWRATDFSQLHHETEPRE